MLGFFKSALSDKSHSFSSLAFWISISEIQLWLIYNTIGLFNLSVPVNRFVGGYPGYPKSKSFSDGGNTGRSPLNPQLCKCKICKLFGKDAGMPPLSGLEDKSK